MRQICMTRHANSARHSEPGNPLSTAYPSLTEMGVNQARATARQEIFSTIAQSEPGTVYCILACSDQERTRDTARVYGAELQRIASGRDDLLVLTEEQIGTSYREQGSVMATLERIREMHKPDQKMVISFPLRLKELSYAYQNRWTKSGKKTEYFETLLDSFSGSHAEAAKHWIWQNGWLAAEGRWLQGPKPADVAQQYLNGMIRVQKFTQQAFPDNNVIVHGVGHQWDLDALVTSFSDKEVTLESFNRATGGTVIGESEFMKIELGQENSVQYREKKITGRNS